jgi:hypothetical protein
VPAVGWRRRAACRAFAHLVCRTSVCLAHWSDGCWAAPRKSRSTSVAGMAWTTSRPPTGATRVRRAVLSVTAAAVPVSALDVGPIQKMWPSFLCCDPPLRRRHRPCLLAGPHQYRDDFSDDDDDVDDDDGAGDDRGDRHHRHDAGVVNLAHNNNNGVRSSSHANPNTSGTAHMPSPILHEDVRCAFYLWPRRAILPPLPVRFTSPPACDIPRFRGGGQGGRASDRNRHARANDGRAAADGHRHTGV